MATYPTPAQVDAAIPVDGEPSRALTNEIIKGLAIPPTFSQVASVPASLTAAQAAGTASIRAIGTTATTAAAGNHTHGAATTTTAGFMSATDKAKLDAIPAVTPTVAPTIVINDPVDDDNIQASFDALILALKTAGVLT